MNSSFITSRPGDEVTLASTRLLHPQDGKYRRHAVWIFPGKGTTDAIFIICQLQEKYLAANKPLYFAFVDLETHW